MNEKLREKVAQHYVAQWSAGADDEGMLKKLYEEGLLFADRIIPFIRQDERERLIKEIEEYDKRHTVSFVLQCLKATVEKEG